MTKNPLLIAILLTLLTACMSSPEGAPAPQVTVTPEATVTSTPLPTETPLPTLTPTPVAVDGIAEDAEGNKLAYINGEWVVLPSLDADHAKLMVDGEKVVAVGADGEVAFEYDMAAHNWVEVEKEPQTVILAKNDQMARDLESIQPPENVSRILDVNGNPYAYGYLGSIFPGERDYFSAEVIGFGDYDNDNDSQSLLLRVVFENGDEYRFYADMYSGNNRVNPIAFVKNRIDVTRNDNFDFSGNNAGDNLAKFMQESGIGHQILFRINPGNNNEEGIRALIAVLKGEAVTSAVSRALRGDRLHMEVLNIVIQDEGLRP